MKFSKEMIEFLKSPRVPVFGELTNEERECLEAGALKQARPFQIKCYEQARRDGDHRSADRYRDIIVHFHVRDLLVQMKSKP